MDLYNALQYTPQMRIGVRGRGFDAGGGKEGAGEEIEEIQTDRIQTDGIQTDQIQTDRIQTDRIQTDRIQTDRSRQTGPDRPVQTDQSRPTRWGRSDENRTPPAWERNFVKKMSATLHGSAFQK